jgi:hypothetical protein
MLSSPLRQPRDVALALDRVGKVVLIVKAQRFRSAIPVLSDTAGNWCSSPSR